MEIATRIQDAKLFYEMGKLDESEAILARVLREDPANRTAPYYLDLIKTNSCPSSISNSRKILFENVYILVFF